MKFAISSTEYFNSKGFNTKNWRKNLDGTEALVHYDLAEIICEDNKMDIYNHDDEAFRERINSEGWIEQLDEEEMLEEEL